MSTLQNLPQSAASLSWKETLELFKRLNGGTVGFDYGQHKLAGLRAILSSWIANGIPAAAIDGHAQAIVAARNAAATANIPPPPAWANIVGVDPAAYVTPAAPTVQQAIHAAIAALPAAPTQEAPAIPAAPVAALPLAPLPVAVAATLAPATPTALPAGRKLARDIFADLPQVIIDAIPATLSVPVFANPDAEAIDYDYRFQASTLVPALIAMATSPAMRIWCGGAQGTGKTEFVRALAARTGRALYRVSFNRFTEASEIIGDMGLRNGETIWQDGPVAAALRVADGSAALLLDELTYGSPGALACLNGLLERSGAAVRLPRTGEALHVHPDLLIAVCDNTFGAGNDNGDYAARQALGADLRSRFGYKLLFTYLPENEERDLLRNAIQKATGRKPSAAAMKPIVSLMRVCRAKADSGELQGAPSFRGAVAFATLLAFDVKPADAFTSTVILGAPETSHEALRLCFSSVWPVDATGNLQTFQGEI